MFVDAMTDAHHEPVFSPCRHLKLISWKCLLLYDQAVIAARSEWTVRTRERLLVVRNPRRHCQTIGSKKTCMINASPRGKYSKGLFKTRRKKKKKQRPAEKLPGQTIEKSRFALLVIVNRGRLAMHYSIWRTNNLSPKRLSHALQSHANT